VVAASEETVAEVLPVVQLYVNPDPPLPLTVAEPVELPLHNRSVLLLMVAVTVAQSTGAVNFALNRSANPVEVMPG
jgi:hypothetical protein